MHRLKQNSSTDSAVPISSPSAFSLFAALSLPLIVPFSALAVAALLLQGIER